MEKNKKNLTEFCDERALYSQRDPRWGGLTIGKTNLKMKDWGCTITAVCKMIFDLTGVNITPDVALREFTFDGGGRLYWWSINNFAKERGLKLKFEDRVRKAPDYHVGEEYSKKENGKGMVVELRRIPRHWVCLIRFGASNYPYILALDPWYGRIRKISKKEISGYATFSSEEL